MRIQIIIDDSGHREHDRALQKYAREARDAIRKYIRDEGESAISLGVKFLSLAYPLLHLKNEIAISDGLIFVMHAGQRQNIDTYVKRLADEDLTERRLKLYGKWVGFVVVGAKSPLQFNRAADTVIGTCNRAGMLMPPHAFAFPRVHFAHEHKRISIDIARAMLAEPEWNGTSLWERSTA